MEESLQHAESTPAKGVCQQHHRDLEVFCKTDNMYICNICVEQEHQGHRKIYTAVSIPLNWRYLCNIIHGW